MRRRHGHSWFDLSVALALLALLLPGLVGLQLSSSRSTAHDMLRFRMEHLALDTFEALKALDGRRLVELVPPGKYVRDPHLMEPMATWLAPHRGAGEGPWGTAKVSTRASLIAEPGVAHLHRLTLELEWRVGLRSIGKVTFVRLINIHGAGRTGRIS